LDRRNRPSSPLIMIASKAVELSQLSRQIFHCNSKGTHTNTLSMSIGVSNGLNLFFDDIFFQRLREAHPELTIQVLYMWNRQIEDMLENGTIDIGISLLPILNDALYVKKLFSEQLCCIVNSSHRLAGSKVLRFDNIIHEQIAMADENFNTYNAFMARCQDQGVTPNIYKTSDLMSIYVYVLNHNAVGFSLGTFTERFHIGQIRHIPYEDVGGTWDVCVLMNEKDKHRYRQLIGEFSK